MGWDRLSIYEFLFCWSFEDSCGLDGWREFFREGGGLKLFKD